MCNNIIYFLTNFGYRYLSLWVINYINIFLVYEIYNSYIVLYNFIVVGYFIFCKF